MIAKVTIAIAIIANPIAADASLSFESEIRAQPADNVSPPVQTVSATY